MKSQLREAFESCRQGFSVDRVVVDPELNRAFISECHRLGLCGTVAELNRALLNLRKCGGLRGVDSKETSFPDHDEYRFAAEIAARCIERRSGTTLDEILTDPDLSHEFDKIAAKIAPGYAPLNYRWAALNLRKAHRLEPEILSKVVQVEHVVTHRVLELDVASVPRQQGLYVFFTSKCALYVGEAEDLQQRIRKHLDHSDNKGLARWIWDQGQELLHLELHRLPLNTETRIRRALELELIRSRRPLFNVKR